MKKRNDLLLFFLFLILISCDNNKLKDNHFERKRDQREYPKSEKRLTVKDNKKDESLLKGEEVGFEKRIKNPDDALGKNDLINSNMPYGRKQKLEYLDIILAEEDPLRYSSEGYRLYLCDINVAREKLKHLYVDDNGKYHEADFIEDYKKSQEQVDYYNSINYDNLKQTTTYKLGKLWGFKDPTRTVLQNSGITQRLNQNSSN
jgi:hypothetical protein